MKKTIAFFSAILLIFSAPTLFAQMPVSLPMPGAMVPSALERIGVVAAAGGKVELTTAGQVGRIAQSGQPIFMGDEVKTDSQGHLQILLLDETVFTIGPDSTIIIDKFVYDPKSQKGEIKASITRGVFRYVSGKIAAKNPDSVKVKLPTASIGFRGTIVGGSVGANGQGLAALLGPGSNNDSGAQNGSFTVTGNGGDHQDVNRTGFGVEVGADGGVSNVFQLSDNQMNGLTNGLGGGQGGGGQGGGGGSNTGGLGGNTNMGALSGENKVITGDNVTLAGGLGNVGDTMNAVSILGAQNARNSAGGGAVTDGPANFGQLKSVSGEGHYSGSGTFNGYSGGIYAQCDIIFGPNGSVGGMNALVSVYDGTINDSTQKGATSANFGPDSDKAVFTWTDVEGTSGTTGNKNFTKIQLTVSNSGGQIGQQATVTVNYNNAAYSGTGTVSTTLSPGLLPPP